MKTSASLVTKSITEDRLLDFIAQFKDKTFHEINNYVHNRYRVSLSYETMGKVYKIYRNNHTYKPVVPLRELRKKENEWWDEVELLFESQVIEDVANFIYEHFKQYENQKYEDS